ncbi:MAG: potassium-transporting ATPase subunit KdpA, partial [Alphaproteobacteria bacterium]
MTIAGVSMIAAFILVTLLLAKPAGAWMYALYARERLPLGGIERGLYRLAGVDPAAEQSWLEYAIALLVFNLAGVVFLFAVLELQGVLPLNPQGYGAMEPLLALNTAVSFVTNTNWQNYGGESTLSNLSQMVGLTTQNFLSAATGIAIAFA